jgi:hypothetical protein
VLFGSKLAGQWVADGFWQEEVYGFEGEPLGKKINIKNNLIDRLGSYTIWVIADYCNRW